MKTFFLLPALLGCSLCAQAPDRSEPRVRSFSTGDRPTNTCLTETSIPEQPTRNKRSLSESESPMSTSSTLSILTAWKPTCDPAQIRQRVWDFDAAFDISDVFACLNLCIEEGSSAGISALLEITSPDQGKILFQHSVCESLWLKKLDLAITLLTTFPELPLPIDVFRNVRESGGKPVLLYLMHGWRFRYPDSSPLDVVDEIVACCVHFKDHQLLLAFLRACPFLSAGTLKAFEDAIVAKNVPICSAIFRAGVLGLGHMYVRMSPAVILYRRSMRAKVLDLVMRGSVLMLHALISDIEIPFVIQMIPKSIQQPCSFVYLINKFGDSLLEAEALSTYKAACVSGHKDVFKYAFLIISRLNYEIPMLLLALQTASRLGPANIIKYALAMKYVPRRNEIGDCVELMLGDPKPTLLLSTGWSRHLPTSDLNESNY